MTNPKYLLFALTVVLLFTFSQQICESNLCILDYKSSPKSILCNRTNVDFCGLRDTSKKLSRDALYHCTDVGLAPILNSHCTSCSTTEDQSRDFCEGQQICESNLCILDYKSSPKSILCSRKNVDFCGLRDTSGKLLKDTLYHCPDVGLAPTLKSNCTNCSTTEDQSRDFCEGQQICESNLCILDYKSSPKSILCNRKNVDFCGLRDKSGKLERDALYHCSDVGSVPNLTSHCPKLCFTNQDQSIDFCEVPQNQSCICKRGSGDFCGQRTAPYLAGSCVSGTLYNCAGREVHANVKSDCPNHNCTASGDGGADYCAAQPIESCKCVYGNGNFCGQRPAKYLTGSCVKGALYNCAGKDLHANLKGYCPNNDCRDNVAVGTDFCAGFI